MIETSRYAVVDLEATGTGATARIIQVGIVVLEAGVIVETYATDVNPYEPLDDHIKSLTGITDDQLAQAPDFSQVARTIYELLEGAIFVAHNVQFDANLLAEHLFMEGYELRSPRVDTVELAQLVFPTFDKYSLQALSERLGLPLEAAHTAIDDATATAHLFLAIQDRLRSLPKETLKSLLPFKDSLLYESGQLLDWAYALAAPADGQRHQLVAGVLVTMAEQWPTARPLAADFATNREALGLRDRPQQLAFSDLIKAVYDQPTASFIEGPAGLGKTYAYLLTLLAQDDQRQMIVSLPTKLLQEQVLTQEGQALKERFGTRIASLKGSRNYLDLASFVQSLNQIDTNRLIGRYKMQVLVWLSETQTGDLDEIGQKQALTAYFDSLRHQGKPLPAPFDEVDFWQRAKDRAASSQVLLTNHAFLLASLLDQPESLADKVLVVDEAQQFFLAAESALHRQVNLNETLLTLHQLLKQDWPLLTRRLLERLSRTLTDLVDNSPGFKPSPVAAQAISLLRQDVSECPLPALLPLAEVLQPRLTEHWVEREQQGDRRLTHLVGADMAFLGFSQFLSPTTKAYFISATVTVSKRVKLPDLMGIAAYDLASLPVEVSHRQKIWLDTSMPDPVLDPVAYDLALVDRLEQLASLGQSIVVLCRSREGLLDLSDGLDQKGIAHLAQGKHGTADQLKRRYDRGHGQMLLVMGAFWEGVDFAHYDQQVLVVTKLPFDNPQDRFIQKLNQALKSGGKHPFYDYGLPVAGLRLKQALGRVQRQENQSSGVVILDVRLATKPYGAQLRKGLAKLAPLSQEKFPQILSELGEFCYNSKVSQAERKTR